MKAPVDIEDLIDLSCALGSDAALVQGGGGNLSMKDDGTMWVKASGFRLAEARDRVMYVPVGLAAVRTAMGDRTASDIAIAPLGGSELRPSIETTLHAALPHRVVAHVHSVNAIAWTVRKGGRDELDRRLAGLRWAWVPYARPGVPLTRAIEASLSGPVDLLVLANHGIVAGADDCTAVSDLIAEVEERLAIVPRAAPPVDDARLAAVAAATALEPAADPAIHGLATDPASLAHARRGPLYPDHVVFLGFGCPVLPAGADPETAAPDDDTPFLMVEGAGVLVRPGISAGALAMLRCWADVAALLPADAELLPLSREDCFALLGWEAEDYRRKIATGTASGHA